MTPPADQFANVPWFCASGDSGDCIELAAVGGDAAVRDSKNRNAGLIVVPRLAVDRVLVAARAGLLDDLV